MPPHLAPGNVTTAPPRTPHQISNAMVAIWMPQHHPNTSTHSPGSLYSMQTLDTHQPMSPPKSCIQGHPPLTHPTRTARPPNSYLKTHRPHAPVPVHPNHDAPQCRKLCTATALQPSKCNIVPPQCQKPYAATAAPPRERNSQLFWPWIGRGLRSQLPLQQLHVQTPCTQLLKLRSLPA
jgi:hypothetical protein